MARLLNISLLLILCAFIITVDGKWYRMPKCRHKALTKELKPLLNEFYAPKTVVIVKIYASFQFRFPGDNEFTVWAKIKIEGVVLIGVIQGYESDEGVKRIYYIDLYPYAISDSTGKWVRVSKHKFEGYRVEFKPHLAEYFTPDKTDIEKIYVVWDLVTTTGNGETVSETVLWARIKIAGVLYLAEMRAYRDEHGYITSIFVNKYPYKPYSCSTKLA